MVHMQQLNIQFNTGAILVQKEHTNDYTIYHNWRLELIARNFLQIPCQKLSSTDMSYPEVQLKNLESQFPTSNHITNLFKVILYNENSLKPSAACTKILSVERACISRTSLLPEKASLKNRKLFLGLTNKLNLRLWKSFSQVPPCRQRNNSTLIKYEGLRKHAEHPNAVCEVLAYQIKPRTMLLEKKIRKKKIKAFLAFVIWIAVGSPHSMFGAFQTLKMPHLPCQKSLWFTQLHKMVLVLFRQIVTV